MRAIAALASLALLTACNSKSEDKERTVSKTVVIDQKAVAATGVGENGFKIDTDDFKASLDIPGMTLGGKDFDIDGMKLLPGSQVRGMKVVSREQNGDKNGVVTVSFTSPATPDAVLSHAEAQAKGEGWTVARTATGLGATKGEKTLAYKVAAAGTATSGTITIEGDD